MLIGVKNHINNKLFEEISKVFSINFVEYSKILKNQDELDSINPRILIVNLMDVGGHGIQVLQILKEKYPNLKIIAVHSFKSENMIEATMVKGFDYYISIFDFSEDFCSMLNELGIEKPENYLLK